MKKGSKGKRPSRQHVNTKSVQSSVSQRSTAGLVDSFALNPKASISGGNTSVADFAKEGGRRGAEVVGLSTGPTSTSLVNLTVARRRSRYAALTNPYAKRALDVWISNVVGNGHKLVSLCSDLAFKKELEKLWNKWCLECDTTNSSPYGGLEAMAFRSMAEGGDSFIRLRVRRPGDGLVVPLQLQVIESEQVPVTLNEVKGQNKIVGGIEFDPLDEPVFYHMLKEHPGESFFQINTGEAIPVPAKQVIHLHDVKRPSQRRGLPFLSNVIIQLSEIDRYLDAELVRKKCAALIGGFISTPNDGGTNNPFGSEETNIDGVEIEAMEPGTYPVLPPGYDVKFSEPADVGGNFDIFMKQELRAVAAGMNLTYEQLTGDLSQVNDRTIRATMLEFKRIVSQYQANILVHQMHNKIFSNWFDMAVISGALVIPTGLDEDEARKIKWVPDPWDYMNPQQEINATKDRIRCGLESRSNVLIARGEDPDEVDRQIAEDKARATRLGLVFDIDPQQVTRTGTTQFTDPAAATQPNDNTDPNADPNQDGE